ncbi:MAG: alpha-glucosidase [Byssovorax sp.]
MSLPAEPPWWKKTTVYQIYPRSFADGNGDGIGDLRGIIDRLDYVHALGVETIWFSPFYHSPQADFGYDISDHYAIADEYGTLDECRTLIDEIHRRGMKVVFDMVMNHTSNQHPWFLESKSSRTSPRRDFYLWRDGRLPGGKAPPNNWKSMLGGSGWHYHPETDQWYWASFLPFQPDLNYRNPAVKQAMLDVVRHWLAEGVDGLRLDIFNALFKDASFADNPFSFRPVPSEDNPDGFFQRNLHTIDHPDTIAFARELRAVVDEHKNPPRFLVGEVFGSAEKLREYCGGQAADGLHLVFLFKTLKTRFSGPAVRALIEDFEQAFPEPLHPTYVFGNHDRPRSMHRIDDHHGKAKLLAAFQLTVRGVPFIYYGEEIGMPQREIRLEHGLDPVAARYGYMPQWMARFLRRFGILLNRDECRRPMQWHGGPNAGFSHPEAKPWLPVPEETKHIHVEAQESDPTSLLRCYRRLLSVRKSSAALHSGDLTLLDLPGHPPHLVAYERAFGHGETREEARVYLNFSDGDVPVSLGEHRARALVSNHHDETIQPGEQYTLAPYEAVIVLDRI